MLNAKSLSIAEMLSPSFQAETIEFSLSISCFISVMFIMFQVNYFSKIVIFIQKPLFFKKKEIFMVLNDFFD